MRRNSSVFSQLSLVVSCQLAFVLCAVCASPQAHAGATHQASQTDVLTNGLVGYWPFDGPDISGTTATDRSGQGNNGTLTGANGVPTRAIGKLGQALSFDGVDDYVEMTNESSFDFERTQPLTISAWIYPDSTSEGSIVSKMNDASPYLGYELRPSTSCTPICLRFNLVNTWPTNRITIENNTALALNQWYHVAATYDGSSSANGARIFINGLPDAVTVGGDSLTASVLNNETVKIGIRTNATVGFSRTIDDVRIYNRALSAQEVQALYQLGR
jgi:hypothetical protein